MAERGDARCRREEWRRQEATIKAQLKAMVKLAKQEHSAAEGLPACNPWMRGVAVRIFALAEFDIQAPLKYLDMKRRAGGETDVRNWYADVSPAARGLLLEPPAGDEQASRQLAAARKYLSERQLVAWVRGRNVSKGLAPAGALVLEQAGPEVARGRYLSSRYRWLRRCMARRGGRQGRFGHRDSLTHEEFRRKASFSPEGP